MGGNIFDSSVRYDRVEYFDLELEVIKLLWMSIFTDDIKKEEFGNHIQPLQAYFDKESFGDMDIVVNSKYLRQDYIQTIVKVFQLGHGEWSKNGNVLSFLYKKFQIDLIVTPEDDFQTSLDYFAWNDLGNLVGRIAHKFGFKYGHRGAHLIIRDEDYQLGEILLTKDTRKIHELLGLDHDVWLEGFNTMEDVYTWVSNTKYFSKAIYQYENRNHYAKTRDRKRVNYHGFLEWLERRELTLTTALYEDYPYEDVTEKAGYNIREPFFSDLIIPMFPDVKDKYVEIINKHLENKAFKEKFNGQIVMDITSLMGKELGEFMKWAREQIDNNDARHLFIKFKPHTCSLMISSLYGHYKNNQNWLAFDRNLAIKIARNEGLVQ